MDARRAHPRELRDRRAPACGTRAALARRPWHGARLPGLASSGLASSGGLCRPLGCATPLETGRRAAQCQAERLRCSCEARPKALEAEAFSRAPLLEPRQVSWFPPHQVLEGAKPNAGWLGPEMSGEEGATFKEKLHWAIGEVR